MTEMADKDRADAQIAMIYDLRLHIKENDKETFTKDEILELFDTVAREKMQ